jgi:NADPH:quinone reductase-like Zn-dependent oxidoreductase
MKELLEAGKVTPIIDRRYSLSELPDALRYLEKGHAQGKVVITVSRDEPIVSRMGAGTTPEV